MFKQYKKTLILTSLIMLIPMIIGLLLWNQLPERVPSHWGINGEVDGWSSKTFTVFGLPALLIALQWVCVLASTADPKYKNYNPKMLKLVLWICPAISLIVNGMVYCAALGVEVPVETVMPLLVGAMFVVIGNWLPKCKQTYTMGIKLPWTYSSEENWRRTHRLGGFVWVAAGLLLLGNLVFNSELLLMLLIFGAILIPGVYSYWFYRKEKA